MESERPRLHRDNVPAARVLRKRMTASETVLWSHVRGRQFHGMKFRRQHPVGRFVLDFFCEDLLIAIEIDGGIHMDPSVARADVERQQLLEQTLHSLLSLECRRR